MLRRIIRTNVLLIFSFFLYMPAPLPDQFGEAFCLFQHLARTTAVYVRRPVSAGIGLAAVASTLALATCFSLVGIRAHRVNADELLLRLTNLNSSCGWKPVRAGSPAPCCVASRRTPPAGCGWHCARAADGGRHGAARGGGESATATASRTTRRVERRCIAHGPDGPGRAQPHPKPSVRVRIPPAR